MEDNFGVAAGWYPDPLGLPQLRWWDSQAWTEHTSDARAPILLQTTTVQASDAADERQFRTPVHDEELPSRRERRERERHQDGDLLHATVDTDTSVDADSAPDLGTENDREELSAQPLLAMTLRELEPPLTDTIDDVAPGPRHIAEHSSALSMESLFGRLSDKRVGEEAAPTRSIKKVTTYTTAVWMIALMPLIQIALSIFLITVLRLGSNWPIMVSVVVIPYFVVLGLALYDHLMLKVCGHTRPASGWWALATAPVYLLMRAARTHQQTGKGYAPVGVYAVAALSVLGGVLVVPGTVISLFPTTFAAEAADSVRDTAASLGADISVSCEAPAFVVGDSFTCITSDGNVQRSYPIQISLERENGWITWRTQDWGFWLLPAR
ncbi:MAG: DUF2510 domain-containing protein [Rhodoglobus sp.]